MTLDEIRKAYAPPVTAGAPENVKVAMDSALESAGYYSLLEHCFTTVKASMAPQFLGYATLAGLQQNQVIRSGVEMLADEMTRKWVELTGDTAESVNKQIKLYNLQKIFREAFALTGYFGVV